MVRFLVFGWMIIVSKLAFTQSLDELKKHLYYEHYTAAKLAAKNLLAQTNPHPDAWYWLGEIYLQEKKLDSAEATFKQGLDYAQKNNFSPRQDPLIYIGWAHLLMMKGDSVAARTELENLLSQSKYKNPTALLAAARANIDSPRGDLNWALDLLERAAKRDKKNAAILMARGDLYRRLINGGGAITSYNEALSLDPSLAEAYYKQGKIYKSQNNESVYLGLFEKAIQADPNYAPALYELYDYYFYKDVAKAKHYLDAYIKSSEPSIRHHYMLADLEFIAKNYQDAINHAQTVMATEKEKSEPRLYKLLAYSYEATGDSAKALQEMKMYFDKSDTARQIAKDFELMGRLTMAVEGDKEEAANWYQKAWELSEDVDEKMKYLSLLADWEKQNGNRLQEAYWRQQIYTTKYQPSNVDLYNWGLALFAGEDYKKADSVFAIYSEKYPGQVYGYLWRAKSNALIDSTMELGLAVPHYQKLIEVASADSIKNKSLLLSAYGYLGSYEANIRKDFDASLDYFEKLLALDPDNSDANKYASTLKKWIEEDEKTND
jgi:tetratricopeptide (TPR) repeat protein